MDKRHSGRWVTCSFTGAGNDLEDKEEEEDEPKKSIDDDVEERWHQEQGLNINRNTTKMDNYRRVQLFEDIN